MLCICHIKAKTSGQCSSSHCAPKQWNSLPSDICHIQSSHPHALKTVLKTNIYKQYHNKCFSILSPSFVTFLLCTNVYVPAWHRCGMQGIHMVWYYFWGFMYTDLFISAITASANPCWWNNTLQKWALLPLSAAPSSTWRPPSKCLPTTTTWAPPPSQTPRKPT